MGRHKLTWPENVIEFVRKNACVLTDASAVKQLTLIFGFQINPKTYRKKVEELGLARKGGFYGVGDIQRV